MVDNTIKNVVYIYIYILYTLLIDQMILIVCNILRILRVGHTSRILQLQNFQDPPSFSSNIVWESCIPCNPSPYISCIPLFLILRSSFAPCSMFLSHAPPTIYKIVVLTPSFCVYEIWIYCYLYYEELVVRHTKIHMHYIQ